MKKSCQNILIKQYSLNNKNQIYTHKMSDNRVSDLFQSILTPYFISQDNICISGEGTFFHWNCNSFQNFLHAKSHKDQNQVRGYINDLCTIITQ